MSLTPLYVPPSRPSPRPPGEPSRRSEPPVLHRHQAAAIDAERSKLNEERAQLAREKEEFERRQQAVARDSEARAQRQEQLVHDMAPKRRVDVDPIHKPDVPLPTDAKALAARIVEMGRIRRGEIPYRSGPTHPLAKAIVAAAALARGSIAVPVELPSDPRAKAMVLLNHKRHGRIDAADERWLSDYFAGVEATRELAR
jgi:hypothetical protein